VVPGVKAELGESLDCMGCEVRGGVYIIPEERVASVRGALEGEPEERDASFTPRRGGVCIAPALAGTPTGTGILEELEDAFMGTGTEFLGIGDPDDVPEVRAR